MNLFSAPNTPNTNRRWGILLSIFIISSFGSFASFAGRSGEGALKLKKLRVVQLDSLESFADAEYKNLKSFLTEERKENPSENLIVKAWLNVLTRTYLENDLSKRTGKILGLLKMLNEHDAIYKEVKEVFASRGDSIRSPREVAGTYHPRADLKPMVKTLADRLFTDNDKKESGNIDLEVVRFESVRVLGEIPREVLTISVGKNVILDEGILAMLEGLPNLKSNAKVLVEMRRKQGDNPVAYKTLINFYDGLGQVKKGEEITWNDFISRLRPVFSKGVGKFDNDSSPDLRKKRSGSLIRNNTSNEVDKYERALNDYFHFDILSSDVLVEYQLYGSFFGVNRSPCLSALNIVKGTYFIVQNLQSRSRSLKDLVDNESTQYLVVQVDKLIRTIERLCCRVSDNVAENERMNYALSAYAMINSPYILPTPKLLQDYGFYDGNREELVSVMEKMGILKKIKKEIKRRFTALDNRSSESTISDQLSLIRESTVSISNLSNFLTYLILNDEGVMNDLAKIQDEVIKNHFPDSILSSLAKVFEPTDPNANKKGRRNRRTASGVFEQETDSSDIIRVLLAFPLYKSHLPSQAGIHFVNFLKGENAHRFFLETSFIEIIKKTFLEEDQTDSQQKLSQALTLDYIVFSLFSKVLMQEKIGETINLKQLLTNWIHNNGEFYLGQNDFVEIDSSYLEALSLFFDD